MSGVQVRDVVRRRARVVATAAAVVPTVLSAEGMVLAAHDVLELPVLVALGLAGFLELGLIASGLLARASVLDRRPAGADGVATWVLSAISGAFSASHELVGPQGAAGGRSWQIGAASLLAAGLRLAAPLVAAWLWDRVLVADQREASGKSLADVVRGRLLLSLAWAALGVRRAELGGSAGAVRRARRRLDRAHRRALRHLELATDVVVQGELDGYLARVGAGDAYAAATRLGAIDRVPGASVEAPIGRSIAASIDRPVDRVGGSGPVDRSAPTRVDRSGHPGADRSGERRGASRGGRSRSIDDLRVELRGLILAGRVDALPTREAIRLALACSPARARALHTDLHASEQPVDRVGLSDGAGLVGVLPGQTSIDDDLAGPEHAGIERDGASAGVLGVAA